MNNRRDSNQLLVRYVLLPTIFLTVALAGGLRIAAGSGAFLFVAPSLIALVLAVLLMILFVRGRLINLSAWLANDNAPSTIVSHALTLLALFFASAQAFTSVLPESGLFRWMFAFFFLWTLWQNQFASFDARLTLRSLAALFGTAFVLKHMLLASLYAPDGGWLKRLAGTLLEGVTQGTLTGTPDAFAPSTGYISFLTLALYVLGLVLVPPTPDADDNAVTVPERDPQEIVARYRQLSLEERALLREEILRTERGQLEDEIHATRTD